MDMDQVAWTDGTDTLECVYTQPSVSQQTRRAFTKKRYAVELMVAQRLSFIPFSNPIKLRQVAGTAYGVPDSENACAEVVDEVFRAF